MIGNKKYTLTLLLVLCMNFYSFSQVDSSKITAGSTRTAKNDVPNLEASGNSGWAKFLRSTIDFSVAETNGAPTGEYKVVVQFTILTDGQLGEFKPLTHYGYGMEEEVIRALKKSHKWNPANQDGKIVKAKRNQSVTFIVN